MESRLRLKPGENGAKALTKKYGNRLICVRYLYDSENRQRHKTVELNEGSVPWEPKSSRERHLMQPAPSELVLVRVDYHERDLRDRVKQAGGQWQRQERAWLLRYAAVVALDLLSRKLN